MRSCLRLSAAIALLSILGCPGPTPVEDRISEGPLSGLDACQRAIEPYDVSGRTYEGLSCLDDWIEDASEPLLSSGLRLRAETLLDLWVFSQVSAGLDDSNSTAATQLLAEYLNIDDDWAYPDLIDSLVSSIEIDLEVSMAEEEEIEIAREIARFDLTADGAAWQFGRWSRAVYSGPRLRLILAALFFKHGQQWLQPGDTHADEFFNRFAWLCDAEAESAREDLAGRCGYWCGALPEEAPLPDSVEREAHELRGEETPVADEGTDETPTIDPTELRWWPTPGDVGYELVQICGADYFGLPNQGAIVLLDESNFVDLVYLGFLGELLSGIEADLIRGEPLTVMSSEVIAHFVAAFQGGAVTQNLTPAAYQYDPRLELPSYPSTGPHRFPGHLRVVTLLSSGIHLATRPHIQLRRRDEGGFEIAYAEAESNLHYPGEPIVPFSRLNRLETGVIEDGRLLGLESGIREFEEVLARNGWRSPTAGEGSPCGVEAGAAVSVLADGSTRLDAFLATISSLAWCEYEDISLQVLHPDGGLAVLPVEVHYGDIEGPHHVLTVQSRRLEVRQWTAEEGAAEEGAAEEQAAVTFSVERASAAPLTTTYHHILELVAADETIPLVVRAEASQSDYGILANTLIALSFERHLPDEVDGDAVLLSAPIVDDGAGAPAELIPAGLILQVGP